MEEVGPENQCGFRPWRGTIDCTFNLLMALRKRQEHNLETFVSFVDLVKAFDSVPRAALFKVPRRYLKVSGSTPTDRPPVVRP